MIPTSLNPLGTRGKTFVTSWNVSAGETIYLPLVSAGIYDMVVDWGDGSKSTITSYTQNTHTYSSAGTYTIKINGLCTLWKFKDVTASREKITSVIQWGDIGLTSMRGAFYRCYYLNSISPYAPNVSDYYESFYWCSDIVDIPEKLFYLAPGLTELGFAFYHCDALQTAPEKLFIKNTNLSSAFCLFYDCINFNSVPAGLFANNPNITNMGYAFRNTAITTIPANLFANNPNITSFSNTFYNCILLESIPSGLFDNNPLVISFSNTFYECILVDSIPDGLFDNNTLAENFSFTFRRCAITAIPDGLFRYNVNATNFSYTFQYCNQLLALPQNIFTYNANVVTFYKTFMSCSALTGSSRELWLNPSGATNYTLVPPDYNSGTPDGGGCYMGCFNLTDYSSILDYWK